MCKMNSMESLGDSYCIETELSDILTPNSCTLLVSELIKFILYRKQQLPYTFDRLKYLITKRNSRDEQEKTSNTAIASVERQFKLAEDGLSTLELIFEKTKEELANSSNGHVREVALLFGSTPMTPKQVYRIHLPEICPTHSSVNHPERKHLIHLLHSVILSNSLCNMLKKPMNPTNMYVFIKKNFKEKEITNREQENISEWFIPKNRYEIPKTGQQFHIKFRHPDPCATKCACQHFKIYLESEEASERDLDAGNLEERLMTDTAWFQACAIFKGFTDVYINGVSVADLWLRFKKLLWRLGNMEKYFYRKFDKLPFLFYRSFYEFNTGIRKLYK